MLTFISVNSSEFKYSGGNYHNYKFKNLDAKLRQCSIISVTAESLFKTSHFGLQNRSLETNGLHHRRYVHLYIQS